MNNIDEIVSAVQKGDRDKYRLIIEMYQQQLFSYTFHLVGNRDEAEDIVQEIFIKAYRR